MGEADPEVVPFGGQEDLRLVRQPAEGLGVEDAVPVALERGPERMRLLGDLPASGVGRADGVGREPGLLSRLDLLPDERQPAGVHSANSTSEGGGVQGGGAAR